MSEPRDLLERLAAGAPAPADVRREHEIRRAIEGGLAAPAAAPRAWGRWLALGAGLAAAAAIVLFWLGPRGAGEPAVVVEVGAIAAPRAGQLVEVPADAPAVMRMPDASRLEAAASTRFVRVDRKATRWRLEDGALRAEVRARKAGETFEITTAEATVVVVGAHVVVARSAARTEVRVEQGLVQLTPVGGGPLMLHAGETWPAEQVVQRDPPAPVQPEIPPAPREPSEPPAKAAKAFDAGLIRRIIGAGKVGDARRMIDDGRKATSSKRGLAELGILAAEADLAERKTRSAIDKYLAVVRDYSSTPQAEQALFAAAQLAFDRPDAGYKPAALLRDYLDTYPRGVFASDAQRLLDRAAP